MLVTASAHVFFNEDRSAVTDSNVGQAIKRQVSVALDTMSNRSHVTSPLSDTLPLLDRDPESVQGLYSSGPLSGWRVVFIKDSRGLVRPIPVMETETKMSTPLLLSASAIESLGIDVNAHLTRAVGGGEPKELMFRPVKADTKVPGPTSNASQAQPQVEDTESTPSRPEADPTGSGSSPFWESLM